MTAFHAAISGALETVRQTAAVDVTFQRAAYSTGVIQAIPGKSTYDVRDEFGAVIRYQSRDFIVKAADLVLDDETVLPQRGDLIKEELTDGSLAIHEVMRADGGEDVWRYSDLGRSFIRIHTKLVGAEEGSGS